MVYVPKTWVDRTLPAIDAAAMQTIEDGIRDAHDGKIDLTEPPAIGTTTPNTGKFTVGQFGDDSNYSEFLSDGKQHFTGDARPVKIIAVTGAQLLPSHHNPLHIVSLAAADGILTSGLDTGTGLSRRIEVKGIDGGIYVKGRIKGVYSQGNTSNNSQIIKIKLNTTNATWEQAGEWRIILNITDGCVVGNFTVFMPPFSIMEYSDFLVYVACDGTTYFEIDQMGFSRSLAGSSAATENFLNNEIAGSNVVIEVADTTGFYEGNQVLISDSENSEWERIKTIDPNTSITIYTLKNSYTTANGAKFDIIDYTQTAETLPTQRGLLKLKHFKTGINSGIEFQWAIPHDIDNNEDIGIVIQYAGTTTNAGEDVVKYRVQRKLTQMFSSIEESIQWETLVYGDFTPPSTLVNTISTLATISGEDHAGKHILSAQIIRVGSDAGDTYSGDIKVIGIAMTYTQDKLGYEV